MGLLDNRITQLLVLLLFSVPVFALSSFVVEDVEVVGLQRISKNTVLTYAPIELHKPINENRIAELITNLHKTGLFEDIKFSRKNNILVIHVQERSVISDIEITGNHAIKTEDLLKALKSLGVGKNEAFSRAALTRVEQELRAQYYNSGQYGAKVTTTVEELPRNRVNVKIQIEEGETARIKRITIIGNKIFREKELLKTFQLSTPTILSFFTKNDQYSKQKLSGDLESLRSYYLDRGYMNFEINSTQVSMTPDKQGIFITISVSEGPRYTFGNISLSGGWMVVGASLKEELAKFLKKGMSFSRKAITDASKFIADRLGEKGYIFSNINPVPEVDETKREVSLAFFVDPGKRVYVRRIQFSGNTKTADTVLRREMRQLEGTFASTADIERSKVRLERLGYFSQVNIESVPVAGQGDQVDLNVVVVEQASGSVSAGIGFSQAYGLLFNAALTQNNFLGTGDNIHFNFNKTRSFTVYDFEHTNPYFTVDGMSRTHRFFYRETTAKRENITDFTRDSLGGALRFGIPFSEDSSLTLGLEGTRNVVKTGAQQSRQVRAFFNAHHQDISTKPDFRFAALNLSTTFAYDTRNRAIFPDRGAVHHLGLDLNVPGLKLDIYRMSYRLQHYFPLEILFAPFREWVLSSRLGAAYGGTYGKIDTYPFFENFFAGGITSLRGFNDNSVGPREIIEQTGLPPRLGDPIGGNFRMLGGVDVIFPMPFLEDKRSVRPSFFADIGNLIDTKFHDSVAGLDTGYFNNPWAFRASIGGAVTWLTPLGPLSFSLGFPVLKEKGDETQVFQFNFGAAI